MNTVTLKERAFDGKAAPDWATAVARLNGHWYWEESLGQENGMRFQNIQGAIVATYDNNCKKGYDASWLLPAIEEAQLPPAPESVAYREEQGPLNTSATLSITRSKVMDGLCVHISAVDHNTGRTGDVAMRLEPDDILQLASDLRRMAMDIKRKQKKTEEQEHA